MEAEKGIMPLYCELIVATFSANNAACNIISSLYGEDLKENRFRVKVGISYIIKKLLNKNGCSSKI